MQLFLCIQFFLCYHLKYNKLTHLNAGAQKNTVLGPVNTKWYNNYKHVNLEIICTSIYSIIQDLTIFTCCMIPQRARSMPWFRHHFISCGHHWWVNFASHCVFLFFVLFHRNWLRLYTTIYLRFTVWEFLTKIFTLPIWSTFCALLTLFPIRLAHYLLSVLKCLYKSKFILLLNFHTGSIIVVYKAGEEDNFSNFIQLWIR